LVTKAAQNTGKRERGRRKREQTRKRRGKRGVPEHLTSKSKQGAKTFKEWTTEARARPPTGADQKKGDYAFFFKKKILKRET